MTNKSSKKLKPTSLFLYNSSLSSLSHTSHGLCRCRIQSSLSTHRTHLTSIAKTIQSKLMKGQLIQSIIDTLANTQQIQLKFLLTQTSHQIIWVLNKLLICLLKLNKIKNSKFQKNQILRCSLKMWWLVSAKPNNLNKLLIIPQTQFLHSTFQKLLPNKSYRRATNRKNRFWVLDKIGFCLRIKWAR